MSYIREKQLRDRVQSARATVKVLRSEGNDKAGEALWAKMYAQDVAPLRRYLTEMVIADAARILSNRQARFQPLIDARARAQKFLGGRPR